MVNSLEKRMDWIKQTKTVRPKNGGACRRFTEKTRPAQQDWIRDAAGRSCAVSRQGQRKAGTD